MLFSSFPAYNYGSSAPQRSLCTAKLGFSRDLSHLEQMWLLGSAGSSGTSPLMLETFSANKRRGTLAQVRARTRRCLWPQPFVYITIIKQMYGTYFILLFLMIDAHKHSTAINNAPSLIFWHTCLPKRAPLCV